ncbi:exosortase family protein XrtF [Lutibacter agarilyticus]|uniref:Exosortase family protein XrtF n=1 Tax=Lutibacter agarilyticus TaxID=1109740 RepID=A0A238WMU1_9FLAO|nr:exosortase family protein XrtF [Lutibacter agarilyticus]SNR47855.1 exosortase family protein XrtF [Lutibacter agarilyticus]
MQSNKLVVIFLIKFFGTYALLSFLYSLYLNDTQNTTNFFSCAPITKAVASQTSYILNSVGYDTVIEQHPEELSIKLIIKGNYVSRIIEGCNAVSIIILFISFIVSFSSKILPTTLYIIFGSFLIYSINVVRIAIICIAMFEYPEYQDILHDIVFPSIIYGTTFLLWFIWIQKFSKLKK